MNDVVRFGIVGCGMISRYHAAAICDTDGAELVGVCSNSKVSANKLGAENRVTVFADLEEMLSSPDVDAVTICTPSGCHAAQVLRAIRAGKHVLVEKPMAWTVSDADEIVRAASCGNVVVASVAQLRYSDAAQAIKSTISDGELGKIVLASLSMHYYRSQEYYEQAAWRGTVSGDGGGILMNQGIHGIDMLCYLLGQPTEVCGYIKTSLRNIEVEDTAVASIKFESGAIASIDATVCSNPAYSKKIYICGEKGNIVMEEDLIEIWSLPTPCPLPAETSSGFSAASDPKSISHKYHAREYADFVRAVAHNKRILVDAAQGRLPVEVISGIYQSSREGRSIKIRSIDT